MHNLYVQFLRLCKYGDHEMDCPSFTIAMYNKGQETLRIILNCYVYYAFDFSIIINVCYVIAGLRNVVKVVDAKRQCGENIMQFFALY